MRSGGLGVRKAVDLAPSAYLASTSATADLVSAILGSHPQATSTQSLTYLGSLH